MEIHVFPCLNDNYGVLVHDPDTGSTAAIDAPEEAAVEKALAATGWQLSDILVTHSHADHTDGVPGLKQRYNCTVTAPEKARGLLRADRYVHEGDTVRIGHAEGKVWETPGHCADHVAYIFRQDRLAFVGDVLFALGCGRVFGDQYDAMWRSLERIGDLPNDTQLFFGHEYTLANGKFALSIEPGNTELKGQIARAEQLRARNEFTCPTTVGAEKAANPFLRAVLPAVADAIGMAGATPAAVFRELRERKNRF